jgi:hypothetical protein
MEAGRKLAVKKDGFRDRGAPLLFSGLGLFGSGLELCLLDPVADLGGEVYAFCVHLGQELGQEFYLVLDVQPCV